MNEVTKPGQFSPGQSGNPLGRPVGARGRFAEAFVADVAKTWKEHGSSILGEMATREPFRFAELAGRLVPRDVAITLTPARLPGSLDATDWEVVVAILGAVKAAIPDAGERTATDVMGFVLECIRAHTAKTIERA